MKRLIAAVWCVVAMVCAAPVNAAEEAPDALVKRVATDVLNVIRHDKDIQAGNTDKIVELVDAKILPYFNFDRMTSLAVGRDWRKASPEQKARLMKEFKLLLVRTYANAILSYQDQTMDFLPFRLDAGASEATVKTQIKQSGRTPIQIHYDLEKSAQGWRVFDVLVAGVSLVTNYRESFSREIRDRGIDGLINTLAAKNKSVREG